ncbi:helix-turn-helix domain-containing protein [Amycolatopsis sp. cmx-4-83]|uniref:helix-turn-helix domain-containing protein n=1 Tax=Amycolatopsis sp. cmx-4-83 TaxID=2790940 RepID=UPI003979FF82
MRTSRGPLGLREFAAALGGGIAPSTLSRWERGSAGIGHFAVRGYANALDRPELVTIADNMARYYGNRLGPGRLSRAHRSTPHRCPPGSTG